MDDKNQNNLNSTDNKISIPPVFNGDPTVAEPSHIDANDVPQDIFVNNQNTSASNGNNIFKIPIETKPKPNMDNSQTTGETNNEAMASSMGSDNNTQANNQSTSNDSTLDKDNPLPQMNNGDVNDAELIAVFIGKNYSRFEKPFNVFALLFDAAYMFYRKMFLYGVLLFVIKLVVFLIFKSIIFLVLIDIGIGFAFNKLYFIYANKKVSKIKYIRSQESFEDLKKICAAKGGTSVIQTVLGVLVNLVITILVMLISVLLLGINIITSVISNGVYADTSVKVDNYFAIGVPSVFEDNSTDFEYSYQYGSGLSTCEFSLYAVKGYESADKALDKMVGNNSNRTTLNVNNNSWLTDSSESVTKTYYYAVERDNKVFVLQYSIGPNADSDCSSYKDSILSLVVGR